ncbi:hypothetical protein AVEN_178725-1, partial [Araneus ventricosus]
MGLPKASVYGTIGEFEKCDTPPSAPPDMPRATVENAVMRFNLILENGVTILNM